MKAKYATREEWLQAAIAALRPVFQELGGVELPDKVRVSVGFTGSKHRAGSHVLGACWSDKASKDGTREIFIVPELDDPVRIADVLVHELCHAALPFGEGHKARTFGRLARSMGLDGKLTATVAGDELRGRLERLVKKLGPFPHAALQSGRITGAAGGGVRATPTQGTRMLKVECGCGCVVRMTRKWLDEVGAPTCGCGSEMSEAA